jgi:hypothetical protein
MLQLASVIAMLSIYPSTSSAGCVSDVMKRIMSRFRPSEPNEAPALSSSQKADLKSKLPSVAVFDSAIFAESIQKSQGNIHFLKQEGALLELESPNQARIYLKTQLLQLARKNPELDEFKSWAFAAKKQTSRAIF